MCTVGGCWHEVAQLISFSPVCDVRYMAWEYVQWVESMLRGRCHVMGILRCHVAHEPGIQNTVRANGPKTRIATGKEDKREGDCRCPRPPSALHARCALRGHQRDPARPGIRKSHSTSAFTRAASERALVVSGTGLEGNAWWRGPPPTCPPVGLPGFPASPGPGR